MTAAVTAAAVFTAMLMVMMITAHIRIEFRTACQQGRHRIICVTADTAVQADPGACQRRLCTAADAAADQRIHLMLFQKACQCAVAAAQSGNHLCRNDCTILNLVNFKFLRMAKMLKNDPVRIRNRNFHFCISFVNYTVIIMQFTSKCYPKFRGFIYLPINAIMI